MAKLKRARLERTLGIVRYSHWTLASTAEHESLALDAIWEATSRLHGTSGMIQERQLSQIWQSVGTDESDYLLSCRLL